MGCKDVMIEQTCVAAGMGVCCPRKLLLLTRKSNSRLKTTHSSKPPRAWMGLLPEKFTNTIIVLLLLSRWVEMLFCWSEMVFCCCCCVDVRRLAVGNVCQEYNRICNVMLCILASFGDQQHLQCVMV